MLRNLLLTVMMATASVASAGPEGWVRVIDGDTIEVGNTRVRLHAIDAPEVDQLCGDAQSPVWPCGAWVRQQTAERFDGRIAQCEQFDTDRYGRIVAKCRVEGGDMGEALVSDGLAFAYREYGLDYDLAEKGAAVNGRGLHATGVMSPAAFRSAQRAAEAQVRVRDGTVAKTVTVPGTRPPSNGTSPDPADGSCAIKGNISGSGERIYHVPGQEFYAQTRIFPTKGERWFCSEAEARAAGWRKARK